MSAIRVLQVEGRAVPVRGNDIDTDRIIPARYLRCVTFEGLGEHAFEDDRRQLAGRHPFDRPEFEGAAVLVVNANFGCGSSREHAPQSLQRWGIRGIVGESFAEIFFGNCVALGIPCLTLARAEVARLQDAVEKDPKLRVLVDVERRRVVAGEETFAAGLPEAVRQAFVSGIWDSLGLLLERPEAVDAVAAALPYVARWSAAAARGAEVRHALRLPP
jgi:3-isopropylmalate/(R)-2-methylmalate dehydratase small subunit